MCGFFSFSTGLNAQEISEKFNLSNLPKSEEDLKNFQSLKFHPRSLIPTISKNSPNKILLRYWQLIPRWLKDDPYHMKFSTFNARVEDIRIKPTFRTPWFQSQRCLIPATWFYEFKTQEVTEKKSKKIPYQVSLENKTIFTIAGLWEVWKDAEEKEIHSCTMLTTKSISPLSKIHLRQPVIIPESQLETWLDRKTKPEEAYKMLKPNFHLSIKKLTVEFNKISDQNKTK